MIEGMGHGRLIRPLAIAALAAGAACGSGSGVGVSGGDIAAPGGDDPDGGAIDAGGTPGWLQDGGDKESDAADEPPTDAPGPSDDAGDDDPDEWPPCLTGGEPGCPCDDHVQCYGGWCVPTGDGQVCTTTCDGPCPPGWTCAGVADGSSDLAFLCVPLWTNLCRPCDTGEDCAQLGDTGGWCLELEPGQGGFCGAECDEGGLCPDGYTCETLTLGEQEIQQCVPGEGEVCVCNAKAVQEGASTPCAVTSDAGTCPGVRMCTVDGLTACDAATPVEEVCNGVDDDCDGVTDTLPPEPCEVVGTEGTCAGETVCAGGQWLPCSAPEPAPEICNGVDDDCDGSVDEGSLDTDGDGTADCVDDDLDGDEIPNDDDVCPEVADPDQADLDEDGEGDACDEDIDGDGTDNPTDCEPLDPAIHPLAEELCDGIDQDCDSVPDDGFTDTDADGAADCVDEDDDDDAVPDGDDNCPLTANPEQLDCDADGAGDACDADDDDDGTDDADDCAPCDPAVHPGAFDGCNAADDDCDDDIDEQCSYRRAGSTFGGGFVPSSSSFTHQLRGRLATAPFEGASTDGAVTIRSGLPQKIPKEDAP